MSTGTYLNELNREQLEAATSIHGPLLILAGAGTGKTKTLVARTCHILDEGVDPTNILLVTFTNKAAGEMKKRICNAVGDQKGNKITACTFHSFCAQFLRLNAQLLGYNTSTFTILSDDDAKEIVSMLTNAKKKELQKNGRYVKNFPTAGVIMNINSQSINDMISIRNAIECEEKTEGFHEETKEIIEQYIEYKKQRNMMDYDDLLLNTVLVLKNFDQVRKICSEKYQYIMCDEYQDTNRIQDALLELLASEHGNLAVVGDDNQSIYRFRGARIENILTFAERWKDCKVVVLVENYRSSEEILDFCNEVMSHALEGIKKNLHGQFHGELPSMELYGNRTEEAESVVETLTRHHEEGIAYKDMAVMVRNSGISAVVESVLQREGIAFAKFGGQKFFSKEIVRNLFAFLRAAVSDKDEIAWFMVAKIYPLIGEERAKQYSAEVTSEGIDALIDMKYWRFKHFSSMQELHDTILKLRSKNLNEQLKFLIDGYYEDLMKRYLAASRMQDDTKQEKLEKMWSDLFEVQVLFDLAEGYQSTREFLDDMALSFANPEKNGDLLNITTIHSAKGLEYDVVYLLDPVQWSFPRTDEGDDEDPEELRCLYVALTRAKKYLHICVSKYGVQYGKPIQNQLSHHLAYDEVIKKSRCDYGIKEMFPKDETFCDFRFGKW